MAHTKHQSLTEYNRRRNFANTTEPKGILAKGDGNCFVVQKHDATRLHFDFRLEMDGVLKSWAVTKGPSLNPDDKRLAVRTEDHPMSYAEFEGLIPKREYGGGTVMLWDIGTWTPVQGKHAKDINKGHLHVVLNGQRMKGEWLLIKMRGKPREKRENWLLRKLDDGYAGGSDDLIARELTSIKTGRSMSEIAADKEGEVSLKSKKGAAFDRTIDKANRKTASPNRKKSTTNSSPPKFRKPQLATLTDSVPGGTAWLHEIKYDGYRCLLAVGGGKAKIYTRSGLDWSEKFGELIKAAIALDLPSSLIDGEIVKRDKSGNPSFSALQQALKNADGGFMLFAFDLLEANQKDLTDLTTIERKEHLAALLPDNPTIRFADHIVGDGEKLFKKMCQAGQEGIISKRTNAPYRHRRTRAWLKVKCTKREEFVIIGWRKSNKKGRAFSSLLLAQHENDKLVYKGRAGTGFNEEMMNELATQFAKLSRKTLPAVVPSKEARDAHGITPKLVAEIAFTEFTTENRIRHASFLGLRPDKNVNDVRPEPILSSAQKVEDTETEVPISNRNRVIFPDIQATKGDLADYYHAIASMMLPMLVRRPVSVVRCPQGRAKKCFFQKHDAGSFGKHVRQVPIKEKNGQVEKYLYVEDAAGIQACVQMGTIEFHGWGAKIDLLENPDRMVFDLDPDEGLNFDHVKKAAHIIRRQLADVGLRSFAMLSGGKGVHVVVPLFPRAEWAEVKDFSRRFASALSQKQPDRFTATMSKAKRKGKIFIDWLRNQRGSTSVQPYSARARKGGPVAAPVGWEELDNYHSANRFTIFDIEKLLDRAETGDLKDWGVAGQTLPDI
ncbi:DNA ligase D [Candidatus Nitrospira salsa]